MKRTLMTLAMVLAVQGAMVTEATAQSAVRPPPAQLQPPPTALPPAGQAPAWNALPPGVKGEPRETSLQARVVHFLFHLFGGANPQPMPSPFSNECGQRGCPYDMRN